MAGSNPEAVVTMTASLPLTAEQFTAAAQQRYIEALAAAAHVPTSAISITDISQEQGCVWLWVCLVPGRVQCAINSIHHLQQL